MFFFEKMWNFITLGIWEKNWFPILHQITDKVVMAQNYVLSGTFYSKTVFLMFSWFYILFPEFMGKNFWKFDENSTVGLLKLQSTCPEQCFLENSFIAKFVFVYSVFDFQENNSDFRKRFLSGFLEKYSMSPDGRCLEKKLYLKQFYISTSPSFSNFERKRKIIFGRKIFGKVFKNAT